MPRYIAITFAPVQSFIEKSRKLRDLYGSSFILSYLAKSVCECANQISPQSVVVPATTNVTRGIANVIYIYAPSTDVDQLMEKIPPEFRRAWKALVDYCRKYIEDKCPNQFPAEYQGEHLWKREWDAWANHAWEFFITAGNEGVNSEENTDLEAVREKQDSRKQARNWIGINWHGESSTLSGTDSIAYPEMTQFNPLHSHDSRKRPHEHGISEAIEKAKSFYKELVKLENADTWIEETERLSIPEIVKRLVTFPDVIKEFNDVVEIFNGAVESSSDDQIPLPYLDIPLPYIEELPDLETPDAFVPLSRRCPARQFWTGWFQGDGDRMGEYLDGLLRATDQNGERRFLPVAEQNKNLQAFSHSMLQWGEKLEIPYMSSCLSDGLCGRVVYAGGDDFLGVLHRNDNKLTPKDCLEQWWYRFSSSGIPIPDANSSELLDPWQEWWSEFSSRYGPDAQGTIWEKCQQPVSVSTGFVWAAPGVPQRDLLQHLRQTEKLAKTQGRDRLAIRILFNSGNHLDWSCPWRFLGPLLTRYRDRQGGDNWTHIYRDVATLNARHAFSKEDRTIAQSLLEIYFPDFIWTEDDLWNPPDPDNSAPYQRLQGGLLGKQLTSISAKNEHFNEWVISLAQVGFHLFSFSKDH
jgi:CRISPR-associated protein Cmr2